MSLAATATSSSVQSYQALRTPQRTSRDPDGDGDNEATESAAAKAKEASPVNSNLGRNLNISV